MKGLALLDQWCEVPSALQGGVGVLQAPRSTSPIYTHRTGCVYFGLVL